MAGELESVVRDMFGALDRMDLETAKQAFTGDAQSVDEISRRWLRGCDQLGDYLSQLEGAVEDVRSEIRDVDESTWDDTGMVTCWLEQDYVMKGQQQQHISAPTTVVFRHGDGGWRIVLFHSVPLPS